MVIDKDVSEVNQSNQRIIIEKEDQQDQEEQNGFEDNNSQNDKQEQEQEQSNINSNPYPLSHPLNIITKCFGIVICSIIKCTKCQFASPSYETCVNLSLPIPVNTNDRIRARQYVLSRFGHGTYQAISKDGQPKTQFQKFISFFKSKNSNDSKKRDWKQNEVNSVIAQSSSSQQQQQQDSSSNEYSSKDSIHLKPYMSDSPQIHLTDCFASFCLPELLLNTNQYNCPRCKSLQNAEKQFCIEREPENLILQLKRFKYPFFYNAKIAETVKFEKIIDLTPFMSESCINESNNRNDDQLSNSSQSSQQQSLHPRFYELYALIIHKGTARSGHYYTIALHPKKKKWFIFNDDEIEEIQERQIFSYQAYILFYKRKDDDNIPPAPIHNNNQITNNHLNENSLNKKEQKRLNTSPNISPQLTSPRSSLQSTNKSFQFSSSLQMSQSLSSLNSYQSTSMFNMPHLHISIEQRKRFLHNLKRKLPLTHFISREYYIGLRTLQQPGNASEATRGIVCEHGWV